MKTLKERSIPGPKSAEFLAIAHVSEPEAMADQLPVVWDRAEGVWVTDLDGNDYIDFTSGVLVTNVGHSHPALVEAICRQAGRLMNCYSFLTPERAELAQRLVARLPANLDRVFILSTGAEATEAALRIAKRYTGKHEILAFYGAFHGRTYGAMHVAGTQGSRRGFGPPVPGGILAPFAYCYRCFYDKTYPECDFFCLKALDQVVAAASSDDLGAVIVEPYQGAAGFVFPPPGWLASLEKWARDRGLLLIVDEVQSSYGRTGKLFAIEWEGIRPQMLCLGKGMGSGVPLSALVSENRIFQSMRPGEIASTWGGNPLACAAGLTVLDIMDQEDLPGNALRVGTYLKERFLEMQRRHRCLGDVRGQGLVIGLEIVDPRDGHAPSADLTHRLLVRCAEKGMLLGRVGPYRNVIRIAPPLVITEAEAELGVQIMDATLTELTG
jgi:4-aminobutyrate aminotransferase-like enzyme